MNLWSAKSICFFFNLKIWDEIMNSAKNLSFIKNLEQSVRKCGLSVKVSQPYHKKGKPALCLCYTIITISITEISQISNKQGQRNKTVKRMVNIKLSLISCGLNDAS